MILMYINNILDRAIVETYNRNGIYADRPGTWRLSENLGLRNVYETILELERERRRAIANKVHIEDLPVEKSAILSTEYRLALDVIIQSLGGYFEANGIHWNVFKTPISLTEIARAKLVVCSFGLRGKATTAIDSVQSALMQIYAANISQIRSLYSAMAGKYNFKIWEEVQRWGAMEGSATVIKTALTGGRKLGDVNIIVTNDVKDILSGDRFSILENINSSCIGYIQDTKTIDELCTRLNIENMRQSLYHINENSKNLAKMNQSASTDSNELKSIYDKAFVITLNKEVSTVGKVVVPGSLARSDIFRTGVDTRE